MNSNHQRLDFCTECREEVAYELRKVPCRYRIREKEYDFEITKAFCSKCGAELLLPGMMDNRAQEIDVQYRAAENILSVSDINKLMEIYHIGKAPLSLALGFGEITITRYLQGQMPSREYSDVMRNALESPIFMIAQLQANREKIGETAYTKAMAAAVELTQLFGASEKLLSTISYIFERMQEVTPLALQKILYFIQGLFLARYGEPLYEEDCFAWVHGPVYESVYDMFRDFRYNPIDDTRFSILKNRFQSLNGQEKEVIDLVIDTFGMYSGKVLETITHGEAPWQEAREGYWPTESSNVMISKASMQRYFKSVSARYNINTAEGIRQYIRERLNLA